MATWAIGDIQGCHATFMSLLDRIGFNPVHDRLWLAGDLINRGPDSLGVLRWCYRHQQSIDVVLGNHDLHFLAVVHGARAFKPGKDTFGDVLDAADGPELARWLREQPLIHVDRQHILAHAGIAPGWDLSEAMACAGEVETLLRSDEGPQWFRQMYGNGPDRWSPDLEGAARLRFIINAFTRMRICDHEGRLDLQFKKGRGHWPTGYTPWFDCPARRPLPYPVLFGHWAALKGESQRDDAIALDTGCVWGGRLTAYCLESAQRISIPSEDPLPEDGEPD